MDVNLNEKIVLDTNPEYSVEFLYRCLQRNDNIISFLFSVTHNSSLAWTFVFQTCERFVCQAEGEKYKPHVVTTNF